MLLIGQYDSPFVRRVAVALKLYGLAYEHADWSTFGDVEKVAAHNPLRRVPTLVMDTGETLIDSFAILEALDEEMGPARAALARQGRGRREMLRLSAFAAGAADKGVALVYERAFREGLPMWVERCRTQVTETLDLLERERAARPSPWLFGEAMSHADVMLGAMWRFLVEAVPGGVVTADRHPALARHGDACEALAAFTQTYRPYMLTPPAA